MKKSPEQIQQWLSEHSQSNITMVFILSLIQEIGYDPKIRFYHGHDDNPEVSCYDFYEWYHKD